MLVGAALALWLRPGPPSRVTRENFDRIHEGMRRTEIEAILGRPGDNATEPVAYSLSYWGNGTSDVWAGDDAVIVVFYDDSEGGAVHLLQPEKPEVSRLGRLIWRIRRQWDRWFP